MCVKFGFIIIRPKATVSVPVQAFSFPSFPLARPRHPPVCVFTFVHFKTALDTLFDFSLSDFPPSRPAVRKEAQ